MIKRSKTSLKIFFSKIKLFTQNTSHFYVLENSVNALVFLITKENSVSLKCYSELHKNNVPA